MQKPSIDTIRAVTSRTYPEITPDIRDSMAIPSFLHRNPLVRGLVWKRYEVMSEMGGFTKDETVLEFGCGPGFFLPELAARGCRILALDLYPQYARDLCRTMGIHAEFPESVQVIQDGTVNAVIAAQVMEHIENPAEYCAGFRRILARNGRLLMSLPTENIMYKAGRLAAGFSGKGDYHVSGLKSILYLVEASGFERKKAVTIPSPCIPLYKVYEFRKLEAQCT